MRCPYCNGENTQVKDSRPTEETAAYCGGACASFCGGRFTTFERVQLRDVVVIKRARPGGCPSTARSCSAPWRWLCAANPRFQPERIERMVSGLVRQLESGGEQEVKSSG